MRLKIVNALLIIVSMILSLMMFTNKNVDFDFLNNLFNKMTSHMKIIKEKEVSSINYFNYLDKYIYTNEAHSIYFPYEATVMSVKENMLILKSTSGYLCFFENVLDINVNVFDRVNSDYKLATFIDYFIFYYVKEGKKYS